MVFIAGGLVAIGSACDTATEYTVLVSASENAAFVGRAAVVVVVVFVLFLEGILVAKICSSWPVNIKRNRNSVNKSARNSFLRAKVK